MRAPLKNAVAVVAAIAIAAIATAFAWHEVRKAERTGAATRKAVASLVPDIRRLEAYEEVEKGFDAAFASVGAAPQATAILDAAGIPAPSQAQLSEDDPGEGWKTRRASLQWASIPTEAALSAVSALSTSTPPWRMERLVVEPLPEEGLSRLDILAVQPFRNQ